MPKVGVPACSGLHAVGCNGQGHLHQVARDDAAASCCPVRLAMMMGQGPGGRGGCVLPGTGAAESPPASRESYADANGLLPTMPKQLCGGAGCVTHAFFGGGGAGAALDLAVWHHGTHPGAGWGVAGGPLPVKAYICTCRATHHPALHPNPRGRRVLPSAAPHPHNPTPSSPPLAPGSRPATAP